MFTEDQLDEGMEREEYDKMTYDASDDEDNDENAEDIYLDKPNSSYRKLVGLLQVNKKRKVNKIKKGNVVIDKMDKVDVDLGNREVEIKYESSLRQEGGGIEKESGEEKEKKREGKDEEKEQKKVEGSNNEDDEMEDEKGIFFFFEYHHFTSFNFFSYN
jgi:hypothetical protein